MNMAQIRWNPQDSWRWLADELAMPALLATPARPAMALPAPLLAPEIFKELAALLGHDRVRQDDSERATHARGQGYADLLCLRAGDLSSAPDAVLYPRGEEEVLAILKFAAIHGIGVVPFGGGTSASGGVTAGPGKLTLDLSGMERVLVIDGLAGTVTAEAGIRGAFLEKALAGKGMTATLGAFERSTLGGWIAMTPQCRGLVGGRLATAHGALGFGAELKAMIAGSEGTLGIITQATIRLRPPLHHRAWLLRDFAGGLAVLREALRQGICPMVLTLSDAGETRFGRRARENKPGLWLEDLKRGLRRFDAAACALSAGFADAPAARRFGGIIQKLDGMALDAPQSEFLTPVRRDGMLDHGVGVDRIETTACWSKLPALYAGVTRALEAAMQANVPCPGARGRVLAHVSCPDPDGARLTFTVIFPRALNDEIAQALAIRRAGMDAVIAHGGSSIGVGEENLPWVEMEKTALGIAALRGLKQALDPENILNPGKRLPPAHA
jgi:alkyldihydroxyacetonephosphate synthase